jgi:hypothetical protein
MGMIGLGNYLFWSRPPRVISTVDVQSELLFPDVIHTTLAYPSSGDPTILGQDICFSADPARLFASQLTLQDSSLLS